MWLSNRRAGVSDFQKCALPLSCFRSRHACLLRCLSLSTNFVVPSSNVSSSVMSSASHTLREQKFGLDSFLFPLSTPIQASIKTTPSDFEVVELLPERPTLLSSQRIDHLIEKSADATDDNIFSIPSNKSEFDTLLLSSSKNTSQPIEHTEGYPLVEKLYQFIQKHKADMSVEPSSISFPLATLPALSNKHVRRCLFGYLLLQGVQFKYKLTKAPDGTLNVNVVVPSPEYLSLSRILSHEATKIILQMKERQVCTSAQSEFTLLETHFLPCPSEEVLNRFQEVEKILQSFVTLHVTRSARSLLLRARDQKLDSSKDETKFLGFIMRKENVEHQQLLTQLARYLGIMINSISFHGIKDRQAITSQLMCVRFLSRKFQPTRGKNPKSVYQIVAAKLLKMPVREGKIEIGDFCVMERPLVLGGHAGNRFRIKLHLSTTSNSLGSFAALQKLLRERCKLVEESGFPNYYGLQRFGVEALVGEYVLRGEWLNVAKTILSSCAPVAAEFAKEIQQYRKKKWKKDNKVNDQPFLQEDDNEPVVESDAVRQDKSDRETFYGRVTEAESDEEAQFVYSYLPRHTRSFFVAQTQALVFNHVVSRRLQKYGRRVLKGDLVAGASGKELIPVINEDSVSIFDVLLPLPHARFQLSTLAPEMQTLINEVCAELGIKWEQFSFEICGKNTLATRSFLLRPQNVTFEVPNNNMAIVAFDLTKGAYATMVLREILGTSPME